MDPHTDDPSSVGDRLGADGETSEPASPGEAFSEATDRISELKEYVGYYLSAKSDKIKVSLRNYGLLAGLGIVGLFAGAALVVTAVVLLCQGIALGLGTLFGHRYWLGDLLTGILLLGLVGAGVMLGMRKVTGASRERTVKKYEQWRDQQRRAFGKDVRERAHESEE